jgi:hypothetical protein
VKTPDKELSGKKNCRGLEGRREMNPSVVTEKEGGLIRGPGRNQFTKTGKISSLKRWSLSHSSPLVSTSLYIHKSPFYPDVFIKLARPYVRLINPRINEPSHTLDLNFGISFPPNQYSEKQTFDPPYIH